MPGAVPCSDAPDHLEAVAAGEFAWGDLVDFYSRHDCDHYAWWPGYRRVTQTLEALPLLTADDGS